jgi:signal transduction histidine kinase
MKRLIRVAAERIRSSSPATLTTLGILYEVVLGLLDYATPEEMSFTIFYLLGVAFVGWAVGRHAALLVSAVAAGIMASHEWTLPDVSRRGILFWNTSTRFLLFCAVGWLTGEITRLNRHLQKMVEARTAQLRAETQKHKATSAQLSEALSRLQTIIANVPMILFAVDRQGVITFEDGRALHSLGVAPGAHVGRRVLEAYGQSAQMPGHMRRALQGEEFSALVEIGPVALETWYSPTRERDGAICGYTGVAVNVTGQRRLERQILEISDREQARLGQEIHDGLCQQLVSLAFDANSLQGELEARALPEAQTAARIAKYLDQTITEARQLARGLFPIRLDAQGLPSALEELARATRERFGLDCRFETSETAASASKTMATHLYRIAQEAVANAIKHAKARSINLRLDDRDGRLELRVEDDGQGMAPAKLTEHSGMGLHIMDYRARSIGGTFSFGPGARGGTAICCCVPRADV